MTDKVFITTTAPCRFCNGTRVNRYGHCPCLCNGSGVETVTRLVDAQPELFTLDAPVTQADLVTAIGNWIDQRPMPNGLNGPVTTPTHEQAAMWESEK